MGHYGRCLHKTERSTPGKGDPDMSENTAPLAWPGLTWHRTVRYGRHRNVFCVDLSAGGRWLEAQGRQRGGAGLQAGRTGLSGSLSSTDGHHEMTRHIALMGISM
jgi:hypothetical protein